MKWFIRIFLGFSVLFIALSLLPFALPVDADGVDPHTLAKTGRFVSVNGVEFHLEDLGPRSGPPIVFIHGLFGSTHTWRDNTEELVREGYRVILFDRIGYGLSDKRYELDYTYRNQSVLLDALLSELEIDQAVFIGHSAGANMLAHFALAYPERVTSMVIVSGAIGTITPPNFVGALFNIPSVNRWARVGVNAVFTRENLPNILASFYADDSFMTNADYDGYWRTFQTQDWDSGFLGTTRDIVDTTLTDDQVRALTMPVLLVWGESDTVTPLEQGRKLAELFPDSTLITYPNIGHQVMEEAPRDFNRDVLAFLGD